MLEAARWDIKIPKGDTYNPVVTFPFDLTGCRVLQQVRVSEADDTAELSADSDDSEITFDGYDATWEPITIDFDVQKYEHQVRVVRADGTVETWFEGVFEVTKEIARLS